MFVASLSSKKHGIAAASSAPDHCRLLQEALLVNPACGAWVNHEVQEWRDAVTEISVRSFLPAREIQWLKHDEPRCSFSQKSANLDLIALS